MKRCSRCKENRSLLLFYKSKNNKDGHSHYCIDCVNSYKKLNKEKIKQQSILRKSRTSKIYEFNCKKCLLHFTSFRSNALCCSKNCYRQYYNNSIKGKNTTRIFNTQTIRTLPHRFNSSRSKAKGRELSWSIDFENYELLQQSGCFYCSENLLNKTSVGLDRINNDLGYDLMNVLPCCGDCNKVRQDKLTVNEMTEVRQLLKYLRDDISKEEFIKKLK